jgi:hypothetical protein
MSIKILSLALVMGLTVLDTQPAIPTQNDLATVWVGEA